MEIKAGQMWICDFLFLKTEIVEVLEKGLVKIKTYSTDGENELLSEGAFEKADVIKYLTEYKFELSITEIQYGGTLENIKEKLRTYRLEDFSYLTETPHWLNKETAEKYKGCASITGNFKKYSNAFSIITNDKKLIQELKALFAKNVELEG